MKRESWLRLLKDAIAKLEQWENQWPSHALAAPNKADVEAVLDLVDRLQDNYPFFHPQYAGQMLKPPHPIAWLSYALTALINPNNHALDGGPATAALELEAVAELAGMLGFSTAPGGFLGHLTSSGTIANLEALWVARELRPGRRIAYGANAHYTHARMCRVLGVEGVEVPADKNARLDMGALENILRAEDIGTVVVTLGTTGLGALDPLQEVVLLARRYGFRVHVDAAYGGFFSLLARREPPLVDPVPFDALAEADSVVIDPHKHGLQPYGCGCVIFRDPRIGSLYRHDSPYTYFTSGDLHLGEISLECSRAGAAAAALWTTLRVLPLQPHGGLGHLLAAGRRAALAWAQAITQEENLHLAVEPETDILCFFPMPSAGKHRASTISTWSDAVFKKTMARGADGLYLAKIKLERKFLEKQDVDIEWDIDRLTALRSVLMKPEHEAWQARLHQVLCEVVESVIRQSHYTEN